MNSHKTEIFKFKLYSVLYFSRPPLWSSGQSFWLQIQRYRVRFPALPDFLSSSSVTGTGSTQPREVNWGATWIKSSGSGPENRDYRKQRLTAVGIRCTDHVTPLYPQKLALTSPTGGGRCVGIVRSRTKATAFFFYYYISPNFGICIASWYVLWKAKY
jgi:hypothetical protein